MNATPVTNLSELITVPWEPRGDRIVVLPLAAGTSSQAGIVVTDSTRERPEQGIVLAAGPGMTSPESGNYVRVESKLGELVSFGKYAGTDFEVQSPKGVAVRVIIMRDCEVLLARQPGTYSLVQHSDDARKVHEAGLICEDCTPEPSALIEEERARLRAERETPKLVESA